MRRLTPPRGSLWAALVASLSFQAGLTAAAPGATLHVVIACDTRADDVGADMKVNASSLEDVVRANVTADALNVVKVADGPGERLDRDAVLAAIAALPVAPDDAVFFFYSGHGAFNPATDAFGRPYGTYAVFSGSDSILYQIEVRRAVERRRPRLSVVVLDCCNALRPVNSPPVVMAPVGGGGLPAETSELFTELFFRPGGTLVLESSAPGEYAFVEPARVSPDGGSFNQGSLFTGAFCATLRRSDERFGWDAVRSRTQQAVSTAVRRLSRTGLLVLRAGDGPLRQADQTVTVVASDLR